MRKPTKQDLEAHERLKADLRIRGTSLAALSRQLDVSQSALTLVGKRLCRSDRIERAIAEALQQLPDEIFPDRKNGGKNEPIK